MTKFNRNLAYYSASVFVSFGLLTSGAAIAQANQPHEQEQATQPVIADYPFYEDLGDFCDRQVNDAMTVEQEIRTLARCHGLNEDKAVAIAKCESSLNPTATNWQGSTAKGIYMFTDPTWHYIKAKGHQFDRHENIAQFMRLYPLHPEWWACDKLTR